jgi:2-phosphosulfolactate phosphatase
MSETSIDVLFAPAESAALPSRELGGTVCVVFDVLRATSSMVTALANGAASILPVSEIAEALAARRERPDLLLAGERDGVRIPANLTGGIPFDLGNSPREFTKEKVQGRAIAMTTTNGTRALRACARASKVLIGSFLNLRATADVLRREPPRRLLLVCSGTFDQVAYEDVLGAGALCEALWPHYGEGAVSDAAQMDRQLFLLEKGDLAGAVARSRNGRRLLTIPELAPDVAFCLQNDRFNLVAELGADGAVRVRA